MFLILWYIIDMRSEVTHELKIDKAGRLVVPAAIRRELSLLPDEGTLVARVEDGSLVIEKRKAIAQRLKGSLKEVGKGSAVDQLIEERRKEASVIERFSA